MFRFEQFKSILDEILHTFDLDRLLKSIVKDLQKLGFDRAGVYLIDEDRQVAQGTWGTDEGGNLERLSEQEFPVEDFIPSKEGYYVVGKEFLKEKLNIDANEIFLEIGEEEKLQQLFGYMPPSPGYYKRTDLGDNFALPIVVDNKTIGSIAVDNYISHRQISEENAQLLSMFVSLVGIAIQNANQRIKRKQAEKTLQESEERFRTVIEASKDAMIAIDQEGLITIFNPAAEKMFGRKKEEMIGQSLECLMPEEYGKHHSQFVKGYFTKGEPHNVIGKTVELPAVRSNGDVFSIELSLSEDPRANKQFVFGVIRDITERKQAEEELKKSRDALAFQKAQLEERNLKLQEQAEVLEEHRHLQEARAECFRLLNSIDSSFIADKSLRHLVKATDSQLGLIYLVSPSDNKLKLQSYYSVDESVIDSASFDVTAGLPAKIIKSNEPIYITRIDSDADFSFNLGFGEAKPKQIIGYPLSFRGNVFGAMIVASLHEYSPDTFNFFTTSVQQLSVALNNAQTFAQVQRQSNELRKANEELAEASRLKSEFLANMSHELRTPLNSILGFSEIMLKNKKGNLNERDLKNLERINRNGAELLNLINEILDLSKIEAGKMNVKRELVDVKKLIETQVELIKPIATRKGLYLKTEINQKLPEVYTDSDKVAQILKNLLSNAVKFTETGGVTVKVERRNRREDPITISVVDTGIGIPEESLNVIFEEFRQADGSTTRKYGGTGLGLSICRRFSHLLGGEIRVQSEVGVGSTFSFIFPVDITSVEKEKGKGGRQKEKVQKPEESEKSQKAEIPLMVESGKKVVLSIDDDVDALALLGEYITDFGVKSITATSGVEGIQKARELQPSLITLDLMMPEMDGWETLKALKSDPITSDIPVVIISILSEEEKAIYFGVVDYLTKPLSKEELYAVLNRILGTKKGIVLVIDDEPDFLELTREWLRDSVDELLTAQNGKEALQILEQKAPDLILLDLMMPEMDGFEFLNRVKARVRYAQIPIVVVTAKLLSDEEKTLLQTGTISIIQKGSNTYDELNRALNQVFER